MANRFINLTNFIFTIVRMSNSLYILNSRAQLSLIQKILLTKNFLIILISQLLKNNFKK